MSDTPGPCSCPEARRLQDALSLDPENVEAMAKILFRVIIGGTEADVEKVWKIYKRRNRGARAAWMEGAVVHLGHLRAHAGLAP